jgi:hypothetical protein
MAPFLLGEVQPIVHNVQKESSDQIELPAPCVLLESTRLVLELKEFAPPVLQGATVLQVLVNVRSVNEDLML